MTKEEFVLCVERSQKNLRRFLASVCSGDIPLAEDIAQEAYVKAYISINKLKDPAKFNSWIFKIAYTTFLNYVRSRRIHIPIEEAKGYEAEEWPDKEFQYENLHQALNDMPLRERTVVVLYYLEGYSSKEISEMIEIKEEAVRQALSRGRKRLKSLLKE